MALEDREQLPDVRTHAGRAMLAGVAAVLIAVAFGTTWITVMPGRSWDGPPPPLSREDQDLALRLRRHVAALAATSTAPVGARSFHAGDLEPAEQYVVRTLTELGESPIRRPYSISGTEVVNVELALPGRSAPDDIIVVGAHYDAAETTRGADDNASGVAALLELAKSLRTVELGRTVRLVAFANEEPPYFQTEHMGSAVYAREARARGEHIVAMLSLECLGYFTNEPGSQDYPPPFGAFSPTIGNFIGFVSDLSSRALLHETLTAFRANATVPSEGLAAPAFVPGVSWSDHSSFWAEDYPAIMVTDTALFRNPNYHRPTDSADRLDYDQMARVVRGLEHAIIALARRH